MTFYILYYIYIYIYIYVSIMLVMWSLAIIIHSYKLINNLPYVQLDDLHHNYYGAFIANYQDICSKPENLLFYIHLYNYNCRADFRYAVHSHW